AIAEADGQSGHGLPPHRTLPSSTGMIGLSRAAAVTALRCRLRRVAACLSIPFSGVRLVMHGL
ncbi:hypothetical protein, partial [Xenorhabdus littoralis]|uniref:hypothetical protein n=1 Tax=Xenorhabdus littoralis TaxID=2582835 RepID=UPI0029E81740